MKNLNNSKLALYLDKVLIANPVLNEHFYSKIVKQDWVKERKLKVYNKNVYVKLFTCIPSNDNYVDWTLTHTLITYLSAAYQLYNQCNYKVLIIFTVELFNY
uniref:Uncharacterized protein n=1 Tax=Pyrrhoderma lamaoense TaxID=2282106 RepID=A0A5B9RCJ8_9AGAM|nr:hypothetical protein PLAO_000058 [Phellinus lamaoensis]QEG57153.1 hypothetical protein PLAO_000058 [Phellinus lamaoensis]